MKCLFTLSLKPLPTQTGKTGTRSERAGRLFTPFSDTAGEHNPVKPLPTGNFN